MGNFAVWVGEDNTYHKPNGDPLHFQKREEAHQRSLRKQEAGNRLKEQQGLEAQVALLGNPEAVARLIAPATAFLVGELEVPSPTVTVGVEKYCDQKMVAVWKKGDGTLLSVKPSPWGWQVEEVTLHAVL
jgi:hypothetical protein